MQGIYNYIPETNYIYGIYSVAAVLYLQFVLHVMLHPMLNGLYFYISTFRSKCAVPSMAVSCRYLISCFSGMLFRYLLNDFEIVPVALIITGVAFAFSLPHALNFCCEVFVYLNPLSFFLLLQLELLL